MTAASEGAFYERRVGARGEERFFATELTRGPWNNDHQHGGPPTALLARAVERHEVEQGVSGAGRRASEMFVVRMTCELLRPIPIAAPLEIVTELLAESRNVHRIAAALLSGDEQLAVALAIRIRVEEHAIPIHTHDDGPSLPALAHCRPFEFPFFRHAVGYHTAMEVRAAEGEFGHGKFAVWMRPRHPLIESEPTTSLQRVMICADAGHGVGTALDTARWRFVNPDTSVSLHRLPVDEWLGMRARTYSEPLGFGLCRTSLSDRHGDLGLVVQSQVIAEART
jgi:hypothetical protein